MFLYTLVVGRSEMSERKAQTLLERAIIIPPDFGSGRMMWRMAQIDGKPVLIHAPEYLLSPEHEGEAIDHRRAWVKRAVGWWERIKTANYQQKISM